MDMKIEYDNNIFLIIDLALKPFVWLANKFFFLYFKPLIHLYFRSLDNLPNLCLSLKGFQIFQTGENLSNFRYDQEPCC